MVNDLHQHGVYKRLLAGLFVLCLSACSLTSVEWDSQVYIVKPYDTLYSIAWRYNLDYRQIAVWNNIASPYTIFPGQRLLLSESAYRKQKSTESASSKQDNRRSLQSEHEKTLSATKKPEAEPVSNWQWPTQGQLKQKFSHKLGFQGVGIHGVQGQEIKAAANGKVVYSGAGLIGYGNLVIIKHNETYLSAYAHNSRLLVKEGEQVRMGQKIAEMGKLSGSNEAAAMLHFEIRKYGKPVDPMKYLPRQ